MVDNDTMLIRELSESYRAQIGHYNALNETVQKVLSRLLLGRGDLSALKVEFDEKQRLLGCIESERQKTVGHIHRWQERKSHISESEAAKRLDTIFQETEAAIKRFLEGEEQLKRHLERMIRKGRQERGNTA